MVDRSNVSGLGMVAVAVVSTGVILASYYHLHRRLESNLKLNTAARAEQRRQSGTTKKKKVRFADDVTAADTSSDGDKYCRLQRATAANGVHIRPALRKSACSSTRLCSLCMEL